MAVTLLLALHEIGERHRELVGGKGLALARLARSGVAVPAAVCVTTEAYRQYTRQTRLGERIDFELNRKRFADMRWEEIWDAALRIRNLFLTTPLPADMADTLRCGLAPIFENRAAVIRSSALGEDSARGSFAGLHDSYVNVRGLPTILEHVRLVWASLWSDRALLYRQELGLDVAHSAMAVLVQEIAAGDRSGVAFSMSPDDASKSTIEAVHGLNQALVDGTVEPDRWLLDRKTGAILAHFPARREQFMVPDSQGVRLSALPPERASRPPLLDADTTQVWELARGAEGLFGSPQDVEWTFRAETLLALQARPITTLPVQDASDQRPWYLSLRRSFENLQALRRKVEGEIIPGMDAEAAELARMPLQDMADGELAVEIERRARIQEQWIEAYRSDCIPLAHGMRLFGQVYNDVMRPDDPHEFALLLETGSMASVRRNRMLEDMAEMLRRDPAAMQAMRAGGEPPPGSGVGRALRAFREEFGSLLMRVGSPGSDADRSLAAILLQLAARPSTLPPPSPDRKALEDRFLRTFPGDRREFAREILELGRASYRLRDDDNISMGRVEGELARAVDEGLARLRCRGRAGQGPLGRLDVVRALRDPHYRPPRRPRGRPGSPRGQGFDLRARQLTGQPAGPGIARGAARVILDAVDLFRFQAGEVLVCDSVDPAMTFVVPLAAAIVERRGGMLIHGAIIAREYGIPCVTGVPEAPRLIDTGDMVTVDGYLGIVIVG
jgi:pyruvate,water dikinase